ncbi:uncharacterized protein LOC136076116 [Hydra vulgaris]|uniref:Uncharacterized protein LOC136076116 n=1 Tax=Hydra vulgaris TaxID=6087 RepID=A0ABM4B9S7_HYDVU
MAGSSSKRLDLRSLEDLMNESESDVDDPESDEYRPSSNSSSDAVQESSGDDTEEEAHVEPEPTLPPPVPQQRKGCKRQRNESKKEVAKRKRNSGVAYTGHRGILKASRSVKPYMHRCRYKCCLNITEDQRQTVFNYFWKLGSFDLQTAYLNGCVKVGEPKRVNANATAIKTISKTISLMGHRVCKDFFLKTLDISNSRFCHVTKNRSKSGISPQDGRGKWPDKHKISDCDLDFVRSHINLFPKYKSHYSRHDNPNKTYLPSHLILQCMYNMYVEKCVEVNRKPVLLWCYRNIFNKDFNISFHPPHTDTCHKCDRFENLLKTCVDGEANSIKTERDLHHRKADKALESKRSAKQQGKCEDTVVAITFDLQQTLSTPVLTTN